ncbi:LRR receptor-like kinase resistance protein [Trifolium pratense]|uniref:LRR receptor-like kinase resistance protein n=1 Tax=Trifolium pratense TaxID=57577 RepID=A0A2K3M602_TRIPR|nr:LRR receptor-like kinase resistance protein [Trifolium pratense]
MLPKDIGIFLPSVTNLNFSWNSFEGNVPSSIGKMKEIVSLDFSNNHFSVNMKVLFLDNNNFSGTLEDVLGNNTRLVVLCISNNSISGTIPSSVGMFYDMQALLLDENLLEGEIPFEISNMSSLQIINLSQNKLIGSIPKFSKLKSLRFLYLGKNELSGSIPFELSGSSYLELVDLTDNKFSGKIPNWMDKLSELHVLLLGGNNLEGGIPTQLCLLKRINIMDLSRNLLNASIPSCFQDLSFGQYDHDYDPIFEITIPTSFSTPYYHGCWRLSPFLFSTFWNYGRLHLEVEFRTKHNDYFYKGKVLESMTGLDLSCNKLTEVIPVFVDHSLTGSVKFHHHPMTMEKRKPKWT